MAEMAETFGDRLQKLRQRKGLTLEALADQVESTKSYLWELENKPNIRPSADLVYKLAKALNTTVGIMLGELEPENAQEEDQVFFRNYQELRPETKKQLSRIMDALLEGDTDGEK